MKNKGIFCMFYDTNIQASNRFREVTIHFAETAKTM